MKHEFTLGQNEKRIVIAYGVLALHSLQESANKDTKIQDLSLTNFANEIDVTCGVRTITTALDLSNKFIKEEKDNIKKE